MVDNKKYIIRIYKSWINIFEEGKLEYSIDFELNDIIIINSEVYNNFIDNSNCYCY
jgi:hypothetical protein